MTVQIRIAHAAGIRKDRLFSSRGHKRRHVCSEAKRGDREAASFFVLQPIGADSEVRIIVQYPFASFAIRTPASH